MIYRRKDGWVAVCDKCGAQVEEAARTFSQALALKLKYGWRGRHIGDDDDLCPVCFKNSEIKMMKEKER